MPTPPRPTPESRIRELRELLDQANRAYYVHAAPIMSDVEFDRLLVELADLERQHPELDDPASPTHRVGGEPIDGFKTVPHALPMLSIDNTYDLTRKDNKGLLDWHDRILKELGIAPGKSDLFSDAAPPILVADAKIDGIAMSLRYENAKLARAITRGDGAKGDDVTANVRTIRAIPLTLRGKHIPEILEIRGEVYFPIKEFERVNKEREAAGDDLFLNPRNAAAGTLKQLDPKITAGRKLGFVAHGKGQISDKKFASSHTDFLEKLRAAGMPVNPPLAVTDDIEKIVKAIRDFDSRRHTQPCATDGVVVRVDSFAQQDDLGFTSKSPRAFVAYKYPAERKTTTLLRVDPQVGKSGKITPRAVMEPVLLAGTVVQHATLHNYGRIRDAATEPDNPEAPRTDIRIGDTVYVEKAGEIIPYIAGVVLAKRPRGAKPVEKPDACPVCGAPVEVEYDQKKLEAIERFPKLPKFIPRDEAALKNAVKPDDRARIAKRLALYRKELAAGTPPPLGPSDESALLCMNPECPAQIREKIIWFAGRKQMDVEGLGEKTVDQIRATSLPGGDERRKEAGISDEVGPIPLNTFADIFRLRDFRDELLKIERMGEKKVDNLLAGMEQAKGRGLARVLAGMGILYVGDTTARHLAKRFPDLDALLAAPLRELMPGASLTAKEAEKLAVSQQPIGGQETGLGRETAPAVYKYLHSQAAKRTFHELKKAGLDLKSHDARPSGANALLPFAGMIVVITGTLSRFDRDEGERFLERLGAKVTGSVSSKTSFVIAGDSPGDKKISTAHGLSIPIWDEERLVRELASRGISV